MKHSLAGKVSAKAAACFPGSTFFSGKRGGAEDNGDGQKASWAGDPSIEIVEALTVGMIDYMIVVMIGQSQDVKGSSSSAIGFSVFLRLNSVSLNCTNAKCKASRNQPGSSFQSIT